jgi:hypothetical protein
MSRSKPCGNSCRSCRSEWPLKHKPPWGEQLAGWAAAAAAADVICQPGGIQVTSRTPLLCFVFWGTMIRLSRGAGCLPANSHQPQLWAQHTLPTKHPHFAIDPQAIPFPYAHAACVLMQAALQHHFRAQPVTARLPPATTRPNLWHAPVPCCAASFAYYKFNPCSLPRVARALQTYDQCQIRSSRGGLALAPGLRERSTVDAASNCDCARGPTN